MSSRRLIPIVAGLIILPALLARVIASGSADAGNVAVDTTGASAATLAPTAQVQPADVSAGPLLVLNPRSGRQGDSISVWGSGFPAGATVDIFVKQEVSDNVGPVAVIEADKDGQFGAATVTVPLSAPPGSLIIQAKEYQGSATAMVVATVVDSTDAPPVAAATTMPQPTATLAASPSATALANPTVAPTLAAQSQPTPTPGLTVEARPTSQPTPQPVPTPQPQPTQQPQPPPQPQPTPQPKPTTPPQPTPQPQPTLDTADTSPAPNSYTVQAGDSLSAIAEQVYGNANDWRILYDANRDAIGGNPNLIHPGTELVVPPRD
jgi:LysM repeat protein